MYGVFKRWVKKEEELARITWDDGNGTHPLAHLIEHDLAFEDDLGSEPALELMTEEPSVRVPRVPRPDESDPSDSSDSSSEDVYKHARRLTPRRVRLGSTSRTAYFTTIAFRPSSRPLDLRAATIMSLSPSSSTVLVSRARHALQEFRRVHERNQPGRVGSHVCL